MTLLVVGAHAMDAEVMAGALAARWVRRGGRVVMLHLTRGERGHPTKTPAEFGSQLEREMGEAAAALGVECRWSGLTAPLSSLDQAVPSIVEAIGETGAVAVVTHWRGSWHPSHRMAHAAVGAAVVAVGSSPGVLYGENCEDLRGFVAEWYAPIAEVQEVWIHSLRCYELFRRSEPGSRAAAAIPYWAYYTAAATVRGLEADLGMAQAFMSGPGTAAQALGLVAVATPGPR